MRTRVAHGFEAFLGWIIIFFNNSGVADGAAANTLGGASRLPLQLLDKARIGHLQYRQMDNDRFYLQSTSFRPKDDSIFCANDK
jgi:hypothetical protein